MFCIWKPLLINISRDLRLAALLLAIIFALAFITSQVHAADPGPYDIVSQAGEDYRMVFYRADASGTRITVTGNTYAAQCRSAPAPAGSVFFNYSARVASATTDQVEVKLSKAQTLQHSGKSGVWDLKQTTPGGLVSYLLSGKCGIKATVTR
jgi:hypothetical protein